MVSLELHHDYAGVSEQPLGVILKCQSETSRLYWRFGHNQSVSYSSLTCNFATVIPAFRINLSVRYSKVNLELHHNYKQRPFINRYISSATYMRFTPFANFPEIDLMLSRVSESGLRFCQSKYYNFNISFMCATFSNTLISRNFNTPKQKLGARTI
jgi:hypothetical protein